MLSVIRGVGIFGVSLVVSLGASQCLAGDKASEPIATIDVVDLVPLDAASNSNKGLNLPEGDVAQGKSKTASKLSSVVEQNSTPTKTKRLQSEETSSSDAKVSEGKPNIMSNRQDTDSARPASVAIKASAKSMVAKTSDDVVSSDNSEKEATAAKPQASASDETGEVKSKAKEPADSVVDSEAKAQEYEQVAIEAASFKGVVPGVSSRKDVEKAWGPAKNSSQNESMTQLYTIEPFKHIEVSYADNKVASVVIRFNQSYPAAAVAKQLDLTKIRPVLVSGELGEILGVSYPERGVLFAFEPNEDPQKPSMKVIQIILEPITAEPFILRAETLLERQPSVSRRDLEQALTMEYGNARAHWLYSRVLVMAEEFKKATHSAGEAVRLEPENARYRVTYAQILGQSDRLSEAIQEAKKAAELSEKRPHVKARAICLQGDLVASGVKPDYRMAILLHTQAIQAADLLSNDPHPAIRVAAKEVLVDGYLGAAHDIAWGDWKEKEKAVPRWLERAAAVADDLVNNEGASEEQRFRVHARALAALVGVRGGIDPAASAKEIVTSGEKLVAITQDSTRKAQYEWEVGMSLYDALQIAQMRSELGEALKYGETAASHFEKSSKKSKNPSDDLVLGRFYFRLGAINASRDHNHQAAVGWFDKAVPLLEQMQPEEAADISRQGETFVSMGVSYWEVGQHQKAVGLTQKGITLMEQSVRSGNLDRASLAVPYHNIATMHRQLGSADLADHYQEQASRIRNESKMK
jgi:tetratricopeptide (TPR) repeat protein